MLMESVASENLSDHLSENLEVMLDELNTMQREAVTTQAKHLLVLAGAGSGKTRVLVYRIAWLMLQGQVMPHQMIAVTFTNKAATEMRHRIEKRVGAPGGRLWVGTFHGLSHRILRAHGERAHLPDNFQIIDSDDQLRVIKRLAQERGWDEQLCDPKRAQGYINRQKDEGKRAGQMIASSTPEQALFVELYRLYEQYCQRAGVVDFAEILLRCYELWRDNPDILKKYHERFKYILVDEFQDTNTIQYAWLKMLCSPSSQLMIVGDDDQSIYGWRGAKIENIHRFHKDYQDVVTVRLEQNYRSTSTILAAANALIAKNASRLGKQLWTQGAQGERIALYGAFNEIDESRFIVGEIQKWCLGGGSYEEVAILYRSNAQSRVLEQALRQCGIPYKIFGGLRFFDRAEIKDVLAYLRLLVNCHDDTAFERVVNFPPRGIGERSQAVLREKAKLQQVSMWEAAKQALTAPSASRSSTGLRQFFALIEGLLPLVAEQNLSQIIQTVLEKTGLFLYVKAQPGEHTQTRLENMRELVQAAAQFHTSFEESQERLSPHSEETLPSFLSEVALDAGEREVDTQVSVKLMTLHSAKGLEFPLVFLCGLEDGLFPHHRCTQDQALLEEERRLCYVGITRAMRKLYLTYAEKRSFSGSSGSNRPSRFIADIPSQVIECLNINVESRHSSGAARLAVPKPIIRPALASNFPFRIGQRIIHPRFGEGTVLAGEGEGIDARVQVNFIEGGKKWLVLAYAKLVAK